MNDGRVSGSAPGGSSGLTKIEQLELRIKVLEQEIPFYSNKAAEAMVQGVEDNTFKMETERRLEELTKAKEEIRRLQGEKRPAPGGANAKLPQPSPPPTNAMLPSGSPPASYAPGVHRPVQRMPSSQGPPGPPAPALSRKQAAIAQAEARHKSLSGPQDAPFLSSMYLEYNDFIACACVSKLWRSRIRKTPGWRRVVLNLETTLHGHVGRISALTTFELLVVTGSTDGKIKFWDSSKNFVCVKTLNITPSPVHKYVHPRLREHRESQRAQGFIPQEEEESAEYPLAVTALVTVDRCVLIGAEDGRFIVWMATTQEKKEFDTVVHSKALNCIVIGGDEFIFTASLDGKVAAIQRRGFPFNPQAPAVWQAPQYGNKRHESGATALAYAGGYLFSGGSDGKIFVWQPRGMEFRRVLQHNRGIGPNGLPVLVEHTDRITSMVGVLDRLYSASWDGSIKLWNARNLECLRDVAVMPIGICWSLGIRRDPASRMTTLVAGVRDNDICVMDWETLEILSSCEENLWAWKLERHSHWVKCIMAFSDGRIVSGSDDWTAKIWHIRGSSQRHSASLFVGLPQGPLSQEDLDIIMSQMQKRAGGHLTAEQLQEQKVYYDKSLKEKMAMMTPEQVQQHEQMHQKAQMGWVNARERLRKERGLPSTAASSTSASAADASAAASNGPNATPGSTAIPATPAAMPSGSPDAEPVASGPSASTNLNGATPAGARNGEDKEAESGQTDEAKNTSGENNQVPVENGTTPHEAESTTEENGGEPVSSTAEANKSPADGEQKQSGESTAAEEEGKKSPPVEAPAPVETAETGTVETVPAETADANGKDENDDGEEGSSDAEDTAGDSEARVKRRKTTK